MTVSVVNGTGAYNQATDTATPWPPSGSTPSAWATPRRSATWPRPSSTTGRRSPAVEAAAEAVARSMTGSVIMAYDPSQVADGAQVTVVTGTQFAVNAPPAAPSAAGAPATTAPAAAPTTTATTSPSASAIAAPSPTTTGLAAMGSPGLPGRRHPDGTGGQPDLTASSLAPKPVGRAQPQVGRRVIISWTLS